MASLRGFAFVAGLVAIELLAATPASAQFGGICGRRDGCGNSNNDFREPRDPREPRPPSPRELEHRRAHNITVEGIAAFNTGNYQSALSHFRRALAISPNNRDYRRNVAVALQNIVAQMLVPPGVPLSDHSRLESILEMLVEADRLGGDRAYSRQVRSDLSTARQRVAASAEAARRQERERQLAEARERERIRQFSERQADELRQQVAAQTQIASLISDRGGDVRRRQPTQPRRNDLGFGDPNISESNPVTRSGQDSEIRQGEGRTGSPGRARTMERLGNIGRGRESLGQGFDGGGDNERAAARIDDLPNVEGISADRLERLNRDPRFRDASAALQRARDASRQAQANQAALEAQEARTADIGERQRIRIAISNASAETLRARGEAQQAEQRQREVIALIEVEGAPIVEEGPAPREPPPPPRRGVRRDSPRQQ